MTKQRTKIEDIYQKKTPYEHILDCPDTYIGDPLPTTEYRQILFNNEEENIRYIDFKELHFSPGLIKICDEILVNARDQNVRDKNLKEIKMNVDKETGTIIVYNDGEGIHTNMHPEFNIHVPELIFSHLLTSTNYDKEEEKITGGKNGFGAKLTNIYSKYFKVETCCGITKEKYLQEYENNMLIKHPPVITKKARKDNTYTQITFTPDFQKFGLEEMSEDIYLILEKRMYDLAACLPNVDVYFNDYLIEHNTIEKYSKLYFPEYDNKDLIYEKVNDRWEILVTLTPDDDHFQHVSFVNGIHTVKGGKHVDYVTSQITKKVAEFIKIKKKKNVKPNYIKDNIYIFINSIIVNPGFDSQTKEYLVTKHDKFGSSCDISDKFIDKLCKTELIDRVINLTDFKEKNELKKTDGKKRGLIKIPKLEDANLAGTNKGKDCTLILTEGDSAKTFAISGLSIIGRDYYGVFPLRGKFLNVRDKSPRDIGKNQEIIHLKQILGLQQGKEYKNVDQLRYGSIMILTDADEDGHHIKGLLINFFEHFWPSLLPIDKFIQVFNTPVVKVSKSSTNISFYSMSEYNTWKNANQNGKGWNIKYYKGLGTSTSNEAKAYFKDINKCLVKYVIDDTEKCHKSIELAFASSIKKDENGLKFSDKRKEWLSSYDKDNVLDNDKKEVSFTDFIYKQLIHFSNSDNIRSIPNIMDGFKPSQRKVIFGCLKRNLYKEIKVSQLSGYISENTAYHHGEMSLQGTIIGLAQNFLGSNNINLLEPNGQFGTRLTGGMDHASSRYIFTALNNIVKCIFNDNDIPLLESKYDDGTKIEPVFYTPIIPTILVNGTSGIGTGYSSKVPCYNPLEIIGNIKRMLNDEDIIEMKPWYMGFNGNIIKIDENRYVSRGIYKFLDFNSIIITELPVGIWTEDYKEEIESRWIYDEKSNKKGFLSGYENHSTESTVKFILKFKQGVLTSLRTNIEKFEKLLHLYAPISSTNMHLYNEDESIKKYDNVNEIIKSFFNIRFLYYHKRRAFLIKKLTRELNIIEFKVKFIEDIIDEKIVIFKKKKDEVIKILKKEKYPIFDIGTDILKENCDSEGNYNYLTSMPIHTFTYEKIEELKKQQETKKAEVDIILSKSEKQLWIDDLDELTEKYGVFYNNFLKDIETEKGNKVSKKVKKHKKKPAKK
jgi:DNA topoisomerase II